MKKTPIEEKKFTLKFILSLFLYVIFFIYEILEKVFNYILFHIKFIKNIIVSLKNKLYASSFYTWLKIKVDKIDERTFLGIIIFLILASGLMIYVLPFILSSGFLKLLSLIIGKLLSTLNIILNSIGIKKIFKIPFIRYLRIRVNRIKRVVKSRFLMVKELIKKEFKKIKSTKIYKKIHNLFASLKKSKSK